MMKHIVFVNPIRNLQTVLKLGSISVFDKVINLCGLTAEKGLKLSKGPKKQNNNVKLLVVWLLEGFSQWSVDH